MNVAVIFLSVNLIFVVSFFVYLAYTKQRQKTVTAIAEYWIYSKTKEIPDQKKLMDRVIGANPHSQKGQSPIGPAEGLVFSDVRWKISRILRQKNPQLFDILLAPDSLQDNLSFAESMLQSNSIIKLQYVSSTKLSDKRHLQFLIHVADSVAEAVEADWIFDKSANRLWESKKIHTELGQKLDATRLELHAHLIENEDHTIESRGLVKIGVRDFVTSLIPHDQMMLARELLSSYLALTWEAGNEHLEPISAYGDQFSLEFKLRKDGRNQMRMHRRQETK